MSPIDKVSDIRRFPRLGKIRMGIKKEGQKGPYPQATDYFVCPEEVRVVYQDTPRELAIMFPSDDLELIAPQYYKCYSYSQGLICKGDGKSCHRKIDVDTGDFANRDTQQWDMANGLCNPDSCPMIENKQCKKVMSLLFILPNVPGLGVYQLDTSSFFSIVNMNSQLAVDGFLRQFTRGRISFLPLILSIEPKEVTPPGVGRKTVHILNVRANVKLADIIKLSRQPCYQVLLPAPEEAEPPDDLYPDEIIGGPQEPPATTGEPAPSVKPPATVPESVKLPTTSAAVEGVEGGITFEGGAILWSREGNDETGDGSKERPFRTKGRAVKEVAIRKWGAKARKTEPKGKGETLPSKGDDKIGGELWPEEPGGGGEAAATSLSSPETEPEKSERASAPQGIIDPDWLKETLAIIRWDVQTVKTWIKSQFKEADTKGELLDVLGRLDREQAEKFTKEIQMAADKVQTRAKAQPNLFP